MPIPEVGTRESERGTERETFKILYLFLTTRNRKLIQKKAFADCTSNLSIQIHNKSAYQYPESDSVDLLPFRV